MTAAGLDHHAVGIRLGRIRLRRSAGAFPRENARHGTILTLELRSR
jgi:hypothetical protein